MSTRQNLARLMRGAAVCALALASTPAAFAQDAAKDPNVVRVSAPDIATVATSQDDATAATNFVPLSWPDGRGPASLTPAPNAAGVQWLVVVIQATLAERGCNQLAVSGRWDETTRLATANVLGTDVIKDFGPALEPSEGLLKKIRSAETSKCGTTANTDRQPNVAAAARGKAKTRSVAAASDTAARAGRQVAAPSATSRPVKAARSSAPVKHVAVASAPRVRAASPRVATAPVAYARPVGVGSF